LIRNDGTLLIRWPLSDKSTDLSRTDLFSKHLKLSSVGYYKIISPFDGIAKYFGYEETPHYPMVVTVAMSEDWLLSDWWKALRTDAIVAVSTVVFRHYRGDGTLAWVESKFKLASATSDPARAEFLCIIRDVTERKRMEDELTQVNRRLTQLAATDGLTGLTNRRTFD